MKGKDKPTSKSGKIEMQPDNHKISVLRRKAQTDDRVLPKEDNKVHILTKRESTNGSCDHSSNHQSSVVKRTPEAASSLLLGNLVKVVPDTKRWTDGGVSWASLPSSVAKIGKEVMKFRDSAQLAAIEAMVEASAAEALIRSLSIYTELRSSANEDDPQAAVEKFLGLQASLTRAGALSSSLLSTSTSSSSQDHLKDALSEKRRRATSWVNAALSTDLSPITLYNHHNKSNQQTPTAVVLGTPKAVPSKSSNVRHRPSTPVASTKTLANISHRSRLPSPCQPPSPPREWSQGGGVEERVELAKALEGEARGWFLGFLECFLDADAETGGAQSDQERVAGMLSQLKKVNDWLDEVGNVEGEEGCSVSAETIERLRKKIYDYLLAHV